MICPVCSQEMESGFLQSSHDIHYGIEKKEASFLPDYEKGDINLSGSMWRGTKRESYNCRYCKMIITPYKDNGKPNRKILTRLYL